MIFVTVGTQLGFDRLIKAMDDWAGRDASRRVVAQIGTGKYVPVNIEHHRFLDPSKLIEFTREAQLIVAHAGIGSILTAMQHRKPILMLPRKASLGEHRNEHQAATAANFSGRPGVRFASDERQLVEMLDAGEQWQAGEDVPCEASVMLRSKLGAWFAQQA